MLRRDLDKLKARVESLQRALPNLDADSEDGRLAILLAVIDLQCDMGDTYEQHCTRLKVPWSTEALSRIQAEVTRLAEAGVAADRG